MFSTQTPELCYMLIYIMSSTLKADPPVSELRTCLTYMRHMDMGGYTYSICIEINERGDCPGVLLYRHGEINEP